MPAQYTRLQNSSNDLLRCKCHCTIVTRAHGRTSTNIQPVRFHRPSVLQCTATPPAHHLYSTPAIPFCHTITFPSTLCLTLHGEHHHTVYSSGPLPPQTYICTRPLSCHAQRHRQHTICHAVHGEHTPTHVLKWFPSVTTLYLHQPASTGPYIIQCTGERQ